MVAWALGLASVVAISLVSIIGVLALSVSDRKLKSVFFFIVSFAAGCLLGDFFFHLIPQAAGETGLSVTASSLIVVGILSSFAIERFLQWRHCHIPTSQEHPHSFAYMNLFGDAIHNLLDGLIIGASYLASVPLGVATTIAVLFHEIPQELGDFSVLVYGGFSKRKALTFNLLTALTAVAGAMVAFALGSSVEGFVPFLIPFAAGNFIYIAGSDLIPELRKDDLNLRKAALQFISISLGVITMALLLLLE
jgi:zinc and cadmium transporter